MREGKGREESLQGSGSQRGTLTLAPQCPPQGEDLDQVADSLNCVLLILKQQAGWEISTVFSITPDSVKLKTALNSSNTYEKSKS